MKQPDEKDIFGLLGINPESAKEKAFTRGLLSSIFQAAALSGPQARPIGGLQGLGQIGMAGFEGYESSMDRTLKDMLINQQLTDAQRRRKRETEQQAAISSYITGLPEDQRARFTAFPTQAAEAMFRERPEQFVQLTPEQAAQRGLPTDKIFQASSKTGKISQVGGGGTTVNVGGDKDPFAIEAAKGQAKIFSDISAAGSTAAKNLQNVKRLESTLGRVETGGTAAFKQFAGNFGIKTEGLDDIQAATAIINRLVPEQRAPGSGPMSDADLDLFKQSLPRIINTPGGNKKIVEGLKDINNYIVKEAKIANDVLSKKITPEEGRNKLLELGDPVQDFFERNQGTSPTSPRVSLPPQDEALIHRYLRK